MRNFIIPLVVLVACGDTKASLTVNNDAPELSILAPVSGTSVEEYAVVEFRALTTDFEDLEESLIVMWSSSLDGLLDSTPPDASGNLYFATNSLQPGSHLITLTVSDTQGLSNNATVEVVVNDQEDAPTIEIRAPLENSVEEGGETEFEVYVNDIQDEASTLAVTFVSDVDGEFCSPTPDSIGIASCVSTLAEGMHQLTYTVTDSHGNQGQAMQLLSVLSSNDVDNDGDGFSEEDGDCNDENANISPGTEETLNGLDDDCDGQIDNGTMGFDDDGDGFSEVEGDCDDADPLINPDAEEICDGIDRDCDGVLDNDTECFDDDGDGYTEQGGDCDDGNAAVSPMAQEILDGLDNDCDGQIDEGTVHFDDDGDCHCEVYPCYGSVNNICNPVAVQPGDCDDNDAMISPVSLELCDGIDQDCNGVVDDNPLNPLSWYMDSDGDGYGDLNYSTQACTQPVGYVGNNSDCDDMDFATAPNGLEACDGIDNDCDGTIDEAASIDAPDWYIDADGDGFGTTVSIQRSCTQPNGFVNNDDDCDDTLASISPSILEVCDGVDNNCDGQTDEAGAIGSGTYYPDLDGDTFGDMYATPVTGCSAPTGFVSDSTDCDDSTSITYVGATEVCDGLDNNCDGQVDEAGTIGSGTYYPDLDGDTFGDMYATPVTGCSAPTGFVSDSTDCDDSTAAVYVGAPELCDGIDNNCNSILDDGLNVQDYWLDSDGDTWGDTNSIIVQACAAPIGMVDTDGDCDDGNATVYPGAQEVCLDGLDNDCSGDADCDDWGACRDIEPTCWVCGDGYTDINEQCDDGNLNNGDGCDATCQSEIDLTNLHTSWTSEGRTVYVFQSVSNTSLSNYATFCEDRGLDWFVPLSQNDAQTVITNCYNLDNWHTWIITYNNTSSGMWGGYNVSTNSTGGDYSSSGFSAIRKWSSSYCDPETWNKTNCWDSDHSYDWLICESP